MVMDANLGSIKVAAVRNFPSWACAEVGKENIWVQGSAVCVCVCSTLVTFVILHCTVKLRPRSSSLAALFREFARFRYKWEMSVAKFLWNRFMEDTPNGAWLELVSAVDVSELGLKCFADIGYVCLERACCSTHLSPASRWLMAHSRTDTIGLSYVWNVQVWWDCMSLRIIVNP